VQPAVGCPEEAPFPRLQQRGLLLVHGQLLHQPLHADKLVGDVLNVLVENSQTVQSLALAYQHCLVA